MWISVTQFNALILNAFLKSFCSIARNKLCKLLGFPDDFVNHLDVEEDFTK